MIYILVEGIDRTNQIDWRSVSKQEVVTKEVDTLEFGVKRYGTKTYTPVLGEEVLMLGENGDLWGSSTFPWTLDYPWAGPIFGGVIVETKENVEALAHGITVTCKDFTEILDSKLVAKTYEDMDAEDIIADLISTFALGFTVDNVDAPVLIDKVVFNYLPLSKCLQKIAEALGNYDWYVDYTKDIHFFENTVIPAPFNLTDTSENYIWNSLELQSHTHQIRNRITVRGGDYESSTLSTKFHDGDGTKAVFNTDYKYARLPTVNVGGVAKTVGLDALNDDADFEVMWNFQQKYIRFTSGNTPGAGTRNIEIIGYPLLPLIVQRANSTSIIAYGLHEYVIIDKTIQTTDAATQRGDAELLKYSNPENTAQFLTYVLGLMAGQVINIQSTIRGVDRDYKIQSISSSLRTPTELQFSVNLVTAEDVGINDILTRLLISNQADGIEITPGEVIQRFESLTESVDIDDAISAPAVDSPPYTWGSGTSNPLIFGFGTWHT